MKIFFRKTLFVVTFILAISTGIFVANILIKGFSVATANLTPHIYSLSSYVSDVFAKDEDNVFVENTETNFVEPKKVNLENIADEEFVPKEDGKMIRINLETMKLTTYEDGELMKEYPVLAKGKPGSYWETPGGEFEIKTKEERHLSSVGRAWMPWSMQFFGNFFIHGWPTYENGTPFPKGSGYSGGCIRLGDTDAQELYKWTDIGTSVSIYSEKELDENEIKDGNYFIINPQKKVSVSAKSFAVGDLETGDVLLQKNGEDLMPIASITKLATALTSLDVVSQRKTITVDKSMLSVEGESGGFHAGEKIASNDLIYPLLLVSSNDAGEILARYFGRENFIRYMNEKSTSIGLKSTYFEDPTGLSENNISTSYDLLRLARYIYLYKPFVLEVSNLPSYKTDKHFWDNKSQFLDEEGYLGGKRGYTDEALETNLGIFKVNIGEFSERTIGVVVLGSQDRYQDTIKILGYIKTNMYFEKLD